MIATVTEVEPVAPGEDETKSGIAHAVYVDIPGFTVKSLLRSEFRSLGLTPAVGQQVEVERDDYDGYPIFRLKGSVCEQ